MWVDTSSTPSTLPPFVLEVTAREPTASGPDFDACAGAQSVGPDLVGLMGETTQATNDTHGSCSTGNAPIRAATWSTASP